LSKLQIRRLYQQEKENSKEQKAQGFTAEFYKNLKRENLPF
jgi:hypothetical protein